MDLVGRAKRIRIYVNEGDRIGHLPAARALVDAARLHAWAKGALQEMISAAPGGFGERALPRELEMLAVRLREMEEADGALISQGSAAAPEA